MNGKVTIRDVAERAGVSPQTVSNYLNGRHMSRAATRDRIQAAIKELGYRPNAAARALRLQRSNAFGILLEDSEGAGLREPFHVVEFLQGSAATAHERGYHLAIALTWPGETESYALRLADEGRVDGLIISSAAQDRSRSALLRDLTRRGIVVVLLQEPTALSGVFTVSSQDAVGAAQAVDHLVELGHERLAFVHGEPMLLASRRRLDGFQAACEAAGVVSVDWSCDSHSIDAARERAATELPRQDRPTAVIAANDVMALGVVQQAEALGLAVPADLSVVGFNDFSFASWVRPALTTVRIPAAQMGKRAVQLLIDATQNARSAESVAFQVELVVRESTGPAPTSSGSQTRRANRNQRPRNGTGDARR